MFTNGLRLLPLFVILLASSEGAHNEDEEHACYRTCKWPPEPLTCNYHFDIEWYYSMSKACYDCPYNLDDCRRKHCIPLNGVERPVIAVNRRLPGPGIHVCEGDTINVTVTNRLENGEGTSIHWHGIHQRNSPYMDGTGLVTQCPIDHGTTFTYTFKADSVGTQFWHAHVGLQRQDGLAGSLVVRQAAERDLQKETYDVDIVEHTIIVMDWLDAVSLAKFMAHHHSDGSNKPESILINGKGKRATFTLETDQGTIEHFTERALFEVTSGKRHRFRMSSNAGTNCAMRISVDNHTLSVIASDGRPFESVTVDSFIIYGGERYDFVLNANQEVGNYWMRVKGLADCRFQQELAVVRYQGAIEEDPTADESIDRDGFELNPLNEVQTESNMYISKVKSLEPDDISLDPSQPVSTYYLAMDFNKVNSEHYHVPEYYPIEDIDRSHHLYSPQINHVSFTFPPTALLTQHKDIDESKFCDPSQVTKMAGNCTAEYCECTHVITADLGEIVELVVIDEGVTFGASHPMHLHGYSFRVIAMEKLGLSTSLEEVMEMDKAGNITRNLQAAPLKDTVIVPDGGYTILRFEANNPGWWLFHCHLEFHVEIGMSLVIHVGDDDDLPEKPENFPKCYDWPRMTSDAQDKPGSGAHRIVSNILILCATMMFILQNKII